MADDTVEIKITATANDLQTALQQAAQAVQGASAAMAKSAAAAGAHASDAVEREARKQAKAWESAFKPMESGFDTMLKGMIMKHQSFSQALAKGATMQHAASAAAAVYDDVAQIPYVGWILAPAAAIAAFAGVMAFGSAVPGLAVGAWNLPNDTVAQLHAGETVMPADFASGFRSAIVGGGGDGPGGGDNYHITIQAIDTQSGAQFLKNNAKAIVNALQGQARNFNPALRSS